MKNFTALPTTNKEWGFWGTCEQHGYKTKLAWTTTSKFLAKHFDLTAEQTRTVLDARFGRHLADDLSFIKNGPTTAVGIEAHLLSRIADAGWRASFETSITAETDKVFPMITKEQIFARIANEHLNIETLETRNSDGHDFHDVSVAGIQAALAAAYEAGRASKKGA
ncbi:MAG: DUF6900 domain-containing protein [Rickettsiales bacterium]